MSQLHLRGLHGAKGWSERLFHHGHDEKGLSGQRQEDPSGPTAMARAGQAFLGHPPALAEGLGTPGLCPVPCPKPRRCLCAPLCSPIPRCGGCEPARGLIGRHIRVHVTCPRTSRADLWDEGRAGGQP